VLVENSSEDTRRIEVGAAKPVDGSVFSDECGGAQITDKPVVFNRLVGHYAIRRLTRASTESRRNKLSARVFVLRLFGARRYCATRLARA
jgi:hypothetical protein